MRGPKLFLKIPMIGRSSFGPHKRSLENRRPTPIEMDRIRRSKQASELEPVDNTSGKRYKSSQWSIKFAFDSRERPPMTIGKLSDRWTVEFAQIRFVDKI